MNVLDGNALLHWVELRLPDAPWGDGTPFVGFVYLDPQGGMSAKGGPADDSKARRLTVRLPIGADSRVLDDAEVRARGLPEVPDWLATVGPQPMRDAPWRRDPALLGKWHKQFPDDLSVMIHDGEPKRSGRRVEMCWVRVDGEDDGPVRPSADKDGAPLGRGTRLYTGTLLSVPKQLTTVRSKDRVRFVPDAGGRHPVAVAQPYLDERAAWTVHGCGKCGLTEGLDPPTAMFRHRFPDAPAGVPPTRFTALCPVCGQSGFRTFAVVDDPAP